MEKWINHDQGGSTLEMKSQITIRKLINEINYYIKDKNHMFILGVKNDYILDNNS